MRGRYAPIVGMLLLSLMVGGCYDSAWFYPAPGQGALVSNGERLGVARRLSEETPGAQSYVVLCVREAYSASDDEGMCNTIVQVSINFVNQAPAPATLDVKSTILEIGGRAYAAKWVYRTGTPPAGPGAEQRRNEVAPNEQARFDLFFDLGKYNEDDEDLAVVPSTGGIPLSAMRQFTLNWATTWAGKEVTGKVTFFRDFTGEAGAGWTTAPGPSLGWGWWGWPYAPPVGVIHRPYRPWQQPPVRPLVKPAPIRMTPSPRPPAPPSP